MTARNRRIALVLSAVIVSSIAGVSMLLSQRPSVEILVSNVNVVPDVPQSGMTQIRLQLILRNVGSSSSSFVLLTLYTTDPNKGSIFDTFSHGNVQLKSGETRTFYEVTNVTGHWSAVAFLVKVFPNGAPSWERSLDPDRSVMWTG
jgi:hypothetical protein